MAEHSDGSPCLDGVVAVPPGYTPCCPVFEQHTRLCVYDVRYQWSASTGWVIAIAESAGGGGVQIAFCPHCGTELGSGASMRSWLRDAFAEILAKTRDPEIEEIAEWGLDVLRAMENLSSESTSSG